MKTKKQSRLMVIFLSFLICMSLMPTTAFAAPGELEINEGNFPDANFRKYVSEKCDTDSNGSLSQNELYKVSSIIIPNGNIATIKGAEHFTNLKTLSLPGNQLTAVDLSKNLALKSLTITDNQLTTLDVSKNQLLKLIHCSGNNLTDLNVTNNLELGVLVCSGNNLTALDVSKNPKLVQINCSGNNLTALDVSKNAQLMLMDCSHNQLTSLDITANEEIIEFKGKDQKYDIEVDESTLTFDLKSLPEGFDKSKVISWTGGTASGDTLKIDSDKPSQVIYTYQTKPNNNLSVTLNVTYKEKVNITFESNGGTGSMPKVTKNAGETYTLPECEFTAPENQEFDTWEIDGKKVAPGTEIKVEKDTVVKATWRDIMVDINFEPGEGSGNMDQETVKKGSTFKLPPSKFEAPENKEFKSWKIGDKEYAPNAEITVNEDTVVVAEWKDKPVIVNTSVMTINPSGGKWADGTTTPKTYTLEVGEYFTLPAAPTKDGYTFLYWKGSRYNPGDKYKVTDANHTFTAVWQKKEAKPDNKGNTSSANINKEVKTSPKTGDNGMMYIYALGLIMATCGMLILKARESKNNFK